MKSKLSMLFGLTALSLAATTACAWRGAISREIENYEPPALYREWVSSRPQPETSKTTQAEDDFEAQKVKLEELKDSWLNVLENQSDAPVFYSIEPARAERLKPAANDPAAAGNALLNEFTQEDLEALALLRNPGVQAKENEFRAALEAYTQAENLDTIVRRYSTFTASLMNPAGQMQNPDSIAAKFPFPGVLALKGEVADQEVKAAWEELQIARRKAVLTARKAYWELFYAHAARETMASMLALMENFRSAASSRYEAGQTNFQDVIKVVIEQEKTQENLLTMQQMQVNMEFEIRELLALDPVSRIGIPVRREAVQAIPVLDNLYPIALDKRQELRRMRAMVGKMERMIEMQETMIYSGYSLNLSLREKEEISRIGTGSSMSEGNEASFPTTTEAAMGAGLLPKMPWYGLEDAYLRETRQKLEAQKKELQMEELATLLGVRLAWFKLDKAARERGLYADRVSTLSESALEASNRGYSAGKVMFSDVIESYAGWLDVKLRSVRAQADLGIARAEMEEALGAALSPE